MAGLGIKYPLPLFFCGGGGPLTVCNNVKVGDTCQNNHSKEESRCCGFFLKEFGLLLFIIYV